MKFLLKCVVVTAFIACAAAPTAAQSVQRSALSSTPGRSLAELEGEWLGVARFADGSQLRMGIQIMRIADGSIGANASMLDQGAGYISVTEISLEGDLVVLRLGGSGLTIRGVVSEDGATITGTGTQRGNSDPIVFQRVPALPPIGRERPQTPKRPYPYDSVEVTFHNEIDDVWLAGTLTKPQGDGPYPAAVFIGGSGQNARNYDSDGHRLPHVLADYLARRGFAVLRYDKRGVYQSSGNYATATGLDFTRDAAAAYDYLVQRADIDRATIGYGSEAYSLNVDVASRGAFVADIVGPAPSVYWSSVRAPVLVLNGALDAQVPADEHVSAIVNALQEDPTNEVDSQRAG